MRKWGVVLGAVASVAALSVSACSSLLGDFTIGDASSPIDASNEAGIDVGIDSPADVANDIVVKDSPAEAEAGPTCGVVGLQCCNGTQCTTGSCCAGTCVDMANDAKNCGACGHDCVITSCSQSQCAPQQLCKVSDTQPGRVRLDSTNAYFITVNGNQSGSLYSCSQTSFTNPTTLFGGIKYGYDLVLDDQATTAFVADANAQKLFTCGVSGCSQTPGTVSLAPSGNLSGLAFRSGEVFASIGVQPYEFKPDGSNLVNLGNGNEGTNWIAAASGSPYVYWQTGGAGTVRVGKDNITNGGSDFWSKSGESPMLVEASSAFVAWVTSTSSNDNVWTCAVGASCSASNQLTGGERVGYQAGALSVDDMTKNVYWLATDANASHVQVRVCSANGCNSNPATLASVPTTQGKGVAGGVTTNAGFVFFTMEDSGAVYLYRVAK